MSKTINHSRKIIASLSVLSSLIATLFLHVPGAAQPEILQDNEVIVVYELPLNGAAGEVVRIYPALKHELEKIFEWRLDVKPQVVLVKSSQAFQKLTRNKLFVAFAIPEKNLIVIDYSKMNIRPFTLRITLKHELCHLLLHRHIRDGNLPKWLDEGICQWVSDGIAEIFMDKNWSGLDAAVVSGRNLRLARLVQDFPRDSASLMLAYEQSKSVIAYIDRHYGKNVILDLLGHLKNGETVETASVKSLSISIDELEKEWLNHLKRTPRWLVYLANNLYGILFFLGALLTVFGFLRRLLRRRAYEDPQEED